MGPSTNHLAAVKWAPQPLWLDDPAYAAGLLPAKLPRNSTRGATISVPAVQAPPWVSSELATGVSPPVLHPAERGGLPALDLISKGWCWLGSAAIQPRNRQVLDPTGAIPNLATQAAIRPHWGLAPWWPRTVCASGTGLACNSEWPRLARHPQLIHRKSARLMHLQRAQLGQEWSCCIHPYPLITLLIYHIKGLPMGHAWRLGPDGLAPSRWRRQIAPLQTVEEISYPLTWEKGLSTGRT